MTKLNYQGCQYTIDFVLQPYYGTANLSFSDSQLTLQSTYKKTLGISLGQPYDAGVDNYNLYRVTLLGASARN